MSTTNEGTSTVRSRSRRCVASHRRCGCRAAAVLRCAVTGPDGLVSTTPVRDPTGDRPMVSAVSPSVACGVATPSSGPHRRGRAMPPAVTRCRATRTRALPAGPAAPAPAPISPGTLRRLELAAGDLAAACLAAMEQRQPWFARLPADQRAGVRLVTQTGVANFVAWLGERGETIRLTAEAFRIAPHDLARRLSLRQTVDLVRIATEVFERHLPPLATDEAERRALVEGVLRFGREIAFAAATVYAGAAETRGAWDARLEALVVDAVVRGPHVDGGADDALVSRAAALGLGPGRGGPGGGRQPGPGRTRRAAGPAAP